jgi:uncharacterized integral membrane protein (TIGR00697 family)
MEIISYSFTRPQKFHLSLTALFCVIVVLSNLIAVKLFQAPFMENLTLPSGLLLYPFSFLISDLITETLGTERTRFTIYLGLVMSVISNLIISFALWLPPYEASSQETFEKVFGSNAWAVYGSMGAYIVGQMVDLRVYAWLKNLTNGKYLWLRNNGSILISQVADTIIVNTVFLYFGLHLEWINVVSVMIFDYFYKSIISVCNTPLFYLFVNLGKKYLNNKVDTPKPILI